VNAWFILELVFALITACLAVVGVDLLLSGVGRNWIFLKGLWAIAAWVPFWVFSFFAAISRPFPLWFLIVLVIGSFSLVLLALMDIRTRYHHWGWNSLRWLTVIAGISLVVGVYVNTSWFGPGLQVTQPITAQVSHHGSSGNVSPVKTSPTPSASCVGTWVMQLTDGSNPNQDLVVGGIPAIETAVTDGQGKAAAFDWLNKIKLYPGDLAYVVNVVLHQQLVQPVEPSQLVTNGCANSTAAGFVQGVQSAIAGAQVTPAYLPTSGTNTGMHADGSVHFFVYTGGSGSIKSIKITMSSGLVIYVEWKCGNVVTPPQSCPAGTSPSTLIQTICVAPKNPSSNVLLNPSVPAQAKGSGTTPPGTSPTAPASSPTDSATGCNGPCPGSSPTPAPPANQPTPQPLPSPIATQPPQSTSPASPPPPG